VCDDKNIAATTTGLLWLAVGLCHNRAVPPFSDVLNQSIETFGDLFWRPSGGGVRSQTSALSWSSSYCGEIARAIDSETALMLAQSRLEKHCCEAV
jgi:hypothetical protein